MAGADHEESAPGSPTLVITKLVCSLRGAEQTVHITPGTRAHRAYRRAETTERFSCNYGVNEGYRADMFGDDLVVSGTDRDGNVRIVERPAHPFFVATLFLPQLSSQAGRPHPLLAAFLQAAAARASATARADTARRAETIPRTDTAAPADTAGGAATSARTEAAP